MRHTFGVHAVEEAEIVDMLRTLGARAYRKEIELVWKVDSAVPAYVRGDPGRLRL